jgi:hypothetical protein
MYIGVDSHKDTLAASWVDASGRQLASASFANSPAGHRQLHAWAVRDGAVERFGIEVELTRFDGHPESWRCWRQKGVTDAAHPSPVSARVPG